MVTFNVRREAILVAISDLSENHRLDVEKKLGQIAVSLKKTEITEAEACDQAATLINEAMEFQRRSYEYATGKIKTAWESALKAAKETALVYGQREFDTNFREDYARISTQVSRVGRMETNKIEALAMQVEDLAFAVNNYTPRDYQPANKSVNPDANRDRAIRESRRAANRAARLANQPAKGASGAVNPGKKSPAKSSGKKK